eukprot:symbB.v1.2.014683.t1/scaffold1073.1/size139849/4
MKAEVNRPQCDHASPLFVAAENAHAAGAQVMQILLEAGAQKDQTTETGRTPLLAAVRNGRLDLVRTLCAFRADLNKAAENGWNPLLLAAQRGYSEVVQLLCTLNASLGVTTKDTSSALHLAVHGGFQEVVEALLEAKADMNQKRSDGCTPAHAAAEGGHLKILKLLCTSKANMEDSNSIGHTPRDLARLADHEQCACFLLGRTSKLSTMDGVGCGLMSDSIEMLEIVFIAMCPFVLMVTSLLLAAFLSQQVTTPTIFPGSLHEMLEVLWISRGAMEHPDPKLLRQELASELQVSVELQGRLAKVRADVAATRQLINEELKEAAAAQVQLQEARRKRKEIEQQKELVELEVKSLVHGSGAEKLEDETGSKEKDVAKARAALLSRAQKMLHRGGADLEAAGANTASLTEAREAAQIVAELEDFGHEDDELYRSLLQLSLQGLERHLDANDPEVLARVHSLAVSLENLGEKTTAEEFYRRAYLGRSKRLGSEHRDVLDSGYNLATCCKNLGKSAEARDLFKTILEGCQRAFGHQNPVTLETAEQLADLLVDAGDLIAAWKLRRQLLEWYRSAYGEDDHSALLAMSKLAHVLVAAAAHGRASPVAAADALRASAQRHQKVFGTNSPQALKATDDLTKFLSKNGHVPQS